MSEQEVLLNLSIEVEVTDVSGQRCDELMALILHETFPDARARVLARHGERLDVTPMGALPEVTTGLVTTRYVVKGKSGRYYEDTSAITDL